MFIYKKQKQKKNESTLLALAEVLKSRNQTLTDLDISHNPMNVSCCNSQPLPI